ncbi:hypothetical protein SpCBS45565_g04359 [Spizellomyces sp. 'palustris']|nr:hypothetical protein SpCBS45565_g04359 [Spizellomyces sp. 'palustris']
MNLKPWSTLAIDTCEILAARGNTNLEAVLELAGDLKKELRKLGNRVNGVEESANELTASVLEDVEQVLRTIDDLVPFLQLALQSCGAQLTGALPSSISPSRLLQASTAVALASSRFQAHKTFGPIQPPDPVQVGPSFPARVYSLFQSSARAKGAADWTWKEDYAKASVTVQRVPADLQNLTEDERASAEAAPLRSRISYELLVTEDLNDGRYHDELEGVSVTPGEMVPGRKIRIPVADLHRLYYSRSGELLNIDTKSLKADPSPVLVVKIVKGARVVSAQGNEDGTPLRLQDSGSRVEYLAFELYREEDTAESEEEEEDIEGEEEEAEDTRSDQDKRVKDCYYPASNPPPAIGLLSVLEYILRLTALEVSEQRPHLDVPDEKLNLYLSNEADAMKSRERDYGRTETALVPSNSLRKSIVGSSVGVESPLARRPGQTRFMDRLLGSKSSESGDKSE